MKDISAATEEKAIGMWHWFHWYWTRYRLATGDLPCKSVTAHTEGAWVTVGQEAQERDITGKKIYTPLPVQDQASIFSFLTRQIV